MKKTLLYLCANDGSDTRVAKEVMTLSKHHKVIYVGIGSDNSKTNYVLEFCDKSYLIEGTHRSLFTIIRLQYLLIKVVRSYKIKYVYVVDEQFYLFFMPFLLGKYVVLDIFDSIFLKLNKEKNKLLAFKHLVYSRPKRLIVTDDARHELLPDFVKNKVQIVPNVPCYYYYGEKPEKPNKLLTICYFGTLTKERGSKLAKQLLLSSQQVEIIAAGWIMDSFTEELFKHKRAKYLGVLSQFQVNKILWEKGDYLLSVYPVNNLNNLYASPNKIFDALQTKTPVIINNEVVVSDFVKSHNIGYVINNGTEIDKMVKALINKKKSFSFSAELIKKYQWENYDDIFSSILEIK